MLRLPLLKSWQLAAAECTGSRPFQMAAAACQAAASTQLQQLQQFSSSSSGSSWTAGSTCWQHADPQWHHQQWLPPSSNRQYSSSSSSSSNSSSRERVLSSWRQLLMCLGSGCSGPPRRSSVAVAPWDYCFLRLLHHNNRPGPPGKRQQAPAKPKPDASRVLPRHNRLIRAPQLMVVLPDGATQLMDLAAAREAAQAAGLDLVEVNPRASPPVAKIMSFYDVIKKHEEAEKARRLQEKLASPKEMQFSARIADHDLEVKLRKVAGWLEQGYRVQLVVKHGREEEAAAQEALEYLLVRVQSQFSVEVGGRQVQRRAVSCLIKPAAAGNQQRLTETQQQEQS